jgi:CCR4-NOT transcription complex subunit 2
MPVSRGGNANGNVGGLYADIDTNKNNTASSGSQLDVSGGLLGGTGLGGLGGIRGLQQAGMTGAGNAMGRAPSSTVPGAGAIGSSSSGGAAAGGALTGDYGLLGLLGVIRMTDDDRNTLALGSDLTMLGLNLGSTEQIYSTFSSPWSDNVATKEPHYQVR